MKNRFDDFIEKIPISIHNNTKTFIGRNIAVFIPERYVTERPMIQDDYHIVIFHSSPPFATINNKQYKLKSGTLLFMSPGTEIRVEPIKTKSQPKYVALNIKKDFFEEILLKIVGKQKVKPLIYDNPYSYKTLDLIEFFMQEFIYMDSPNRLIIDSIETQLVIQLLRDMDLDPIVTKINQSQEKSYVQQAITYIENYYNSNITINEICDAIYISPCHFQRIFKKTMNKTPYQFILEFRLNKAKELLKKEDISIAEIAGLCGFLSSGHFSTVFKKNEGITPLKYRNSID
ncbi:MAG: AraC family transcriptional regulator [Tissierellaceae bacterium]|nr:AraC family transcriptional regulator [Tissierellaceae bacterium]